MGDKDAPQAPSLPKGLPPDLEKFLTCKSEEVTVKDGTLSWISVSGKDLVPADMQGITPDKILNGKISPSLSITPDPSAPGKASIKIGVDIGSPFGVVGPSIPASIEDGVLKADTSGLPQALKDQIDPAIKNLNDLFKANGYKWGPATFGSGTTKLTKVKLAPATQTTTPPAPPPGPPKTAPVTPPPGTPPPVSGGCLGILFLGLAVVGIGAILFFGGPALGLFGAASPGASQGTTTTTSTTTAVTTTSTTSTEPPPQIVFSDDKLIKVTAPFDSLAPGTQLTLTTQGQADLPPDLSGVTVRSAYYRLGPKGTILTGPVTYERTIDLTALGIDPERQGYPLIQLAEYSDDGAWSWVRDQHKLVGGPDGKADEKRPIQWGTLDKVGQVFGLGGVDYLHRQPYPEAGSTVYVGQPIPLGAVITGSNGQALPTDTRPTIANVVPSAYTSPGITWSKPIIVSNPTRQGFEIAGTCMQPGDFVIGVQVDVTPNGSTSLGDKLHLGKQPTSTVEWTTSIHCETAPPPSSVSLAKVCLTLIHTAYGSYPSHFHWLWQLLGLVPPQSTLWISYHIGDSQPITVGKIPITNGMASADTGITSYGMWQWNSLVLQEPNGSTVDLTQGLVSLAGPSVTVGPTEGPLAGDCD